MVKPGSLLLSMSCARPRNEPSSQQQCMPCNTSDRANHLLIRDCGGLATALHGHILSVHGCGTTRSCRAPCSPPLHYSIWGEKLQVVLEEGQQLQSKAWYCCCKFCCWPASWGACSPFSPYNPQRSLSTWAGRQLLSLWVLSKLLHGSCQLLPSSTNHIYYCNA